MKKRLFLLIGLMTLLIIGCTKEKTEIPSLENGNTVTQEQSSISRISIGGGGAFLNPMIDPTDENVYYVTSDMGALYYSYNQGGSWERSETKGVFTQTHISSNGVVFGGGYGVYSSVDKGKTLNLIYPKNVKYSVSRFGWNENLMLASGYDNGYVKCITSNDDFVFFSTIDWTGNFRLLKSDYDGENLSILYSLKTPVTNPMSDIDVYMLALESGVYVTLGHVIYYYDLNDSSFDIIYTTDGCINDIVKIGEYIFFIDDKEDKSLVLYTKDFVTFNDLLDYNTLTNKFSKYGKVGTFNWHFKDIVGNNFNNIFLSFSSPVNEYTDTVEGIMKFNGTSFEWVFDSMYKTRFVTNLNGWSYGCHGPFYGITSNPHDDNSCLVASIETVYLMEYEKEETKRIKTLSCIDYEDGSHSTNGLDVQTTYSVKEDPFNKDHIIICTTDLGIQNSYDNGKTWKRMEITQTDYDIYNTCYDLYFDPYNKDVVYGLWSSRHDAPYNPTPYDKDTTKGAFAVSKDGGNTWDFNYSNGIPEDAISVKMSIKHDENQFVIAVATFNRGFYLSNDGGKNFISLNKNMDEFEGLIFGEDIVLTDDVIYCLTAPYLENGTWKSSRLYEYGIKNNAVKNIDLGNALYARSLSYNEEKVLFINAIPSYSYKWYEECNDGLWINEHGGIYQYKDGKVEIYFENYDGIFYSTFTKDGNMYATDTYGKIFMINDDGGKLLVSGLFNMLKNISFSLDEEVMYVTTFGGGVYKIDNWKNLIND